jgi:hypothetical protein
MSMTVSLFSLGCLCCTLQVPCHICHAHAYGPQGITHARIGFIISSKLHVYARTSDQGHVSGRAKYYFAL